MCIREQTLAREIARQGLARLGVEVLEHTNVVGAEPGRAVTATGNLPADVVVWTAGFRAAALAAEAGLSCDAQGRVLVDASLRTLGAPDVVVAGDAAAMPVAMACKTAMPMGAHAAHVVAASLDGKEPPAHRFGDTGVCVSLGRRDGVVELRRADGSVTGTVWRGRWAAFIKERICRYTRWSLRVEASGLWSYRWVRPKRPLLSAPASPKELAA
jgi:NADH dehydrogenase FAD-containing subunit